MDRNREGRRATIVGSNGFNRRRHRTNSLRASPDEDLEMELQESVRLRNRVKKDRDRERDRERERDFREKLSRNKKRRAESLMNNREETGFDESSEEEESVLDDEDDEEDENNPTTVTAAGGGVRLVAPVVGSLSNNHHGDLINQHSNIITSNHHLLHHRKNFPSSSSSSSKLFKAVPVWKPGDEIIGTSIPRKARSACTKRSHHEISSNKNSAAVVYGNQIHRQPSSSPARQGPVSTSAPSPVTLLSPSSSKASSRKNLIPHSGGSDGLKLKPLKESSRITSSNPEELEIEIAEVLFGLKTQSRGFSLKKEESRSNNDDKSLVSSPNSRPLSVVAPKRKRPRQVSENPIYGVRSSPISEKPDVVQRAKNEVSSPKPEKISGFTTGNGNGHGGELGGDSVLSEGANNLSQVPESVTATDSEVASVVKELKDGADLFKDEDLIHVTVKESSVVKTEESSRVESTLTATATAIAAVTAIKVTSTAASEPDNRREKTFHIDLMAPPPHVKSSPERETKSAVDQKPVTSIISGIEEEKKVKNQAEEDEPQKPFSKNMVSNIDLHLDISGVIQQNTPLKVSKEDPFTGKSVQGSSIANWPGGLPPIGYMTPLQGIVSMDGSSVSTMPIQPKLSQSRPKRCATHCYIASNISYIQQFMKMNPFWPGTASSFGSESSNINTDLHGNVAFRGVNDKSQNPNEKSSHPSHSDSVQRKQQILLQQSLPPNNLLGPTFIFPLNQQQAASSRSGAANSHNSAGQSSSSPAVSGSTIAGVASNGVSFNYPNMGLTESQYLAILQNNAYPFAMPAVGVAPNFRGSPAQAMPLFNGTFYPSQMIHPSQIQHQQSTQSQQVHHNTTSSVVSSSQKHLLSLKQVPQNSGSHVVPESSSLRNFPAEKSHSLRPLQQSVHPGNHENGAGGGESLPTDIRGSWASVNINGQNFAMPIHPQNFALMTPPSVGTGNQSQRQQQQGANAGVSSIPPHSFAMSFSPMSGATPNPGIDLSMTQNYPMFHSFPDSTRQNSQMMVTASAASQVAQKKSYRISEDVKPGVGDTTTVDEERRNFSGKGLSGVGQTIAFTRSDFADTSSTSIPTNNVVDGPALNGSSGPARSSRSVINKDVVAMNIQNAQLQAQQKQYQMRQMMQQQQLAAASASNRSKTPSGNSNPSIPSEQLNSSSSQAAKFPNAISGFVPNTVQSNSGIASQSHQWKNSSRTPISQSPSSMVSATGSTFKNLPPQHSLIQPQMHTQISFGGSQMVLLTSQGQVLPGGNMAPSPVVGSPPVSSISKGSSGSPRTITPGPSSKIVQTSSLSSQPPKHSPSVPGQKSPSILGNPPHATTPSSGTHIRQQSHQILPKNVQQTQLFFSNPYSQVQSPQSNSPSSNSSGPGGFYMQKRRLDQNVHPTQQLAGATTTSSTGVLPPVSFTNASTNDPPKTIAAATSNSKSSAIASVQLTAESTGTLLPAGFSYVHPIPAVVQVKSSEPKQTAA